MSTGLGLDKKELVNKILGKPLLVRVTASELHVPYQSRGTHLVTYYTGT